MNPKIRLKEALLKKSIKLSLPLVYSMTEGNREFKDQRCDFFLATHQSKLRNSIHFYKPISRVHD